VLDGHESDRHGRIVIDNAACRQRLRAAVEESGVPMIRHAVRKGGEA
jgi:hypothetical protein